MSFAQLKIGIFSLFHETDQLFIITLCHSTSQSGPTVLGISREDWVYVQRYCGVHWR